MRSSAHLLIPAVLFAWACKGQPELISRWPSEAIVIDGHEGDWQDHMVFLEDHEVGVGIANDSTHLYICLSTSSHQIQRQIRLAGFVVWLDAEGGKAKTFGIRFPVGLAGETPPGFGGAPIGDAGAQPRPAQDRGVVEIIGPEKDTVRRMRVEALTGIELQLTSALGEMVYEIKVPLRPTDSWPYAIGSEPGVEIGVGFDVQEPNRGARLAARPGMGGRPGGIGGGIDGGPRGGRPGGFGPGGLNRPEPFELWTRVQLAPQEDTVEASERE